MGEHTPTPWRIRTTGNVGNAIEAYSGKHYSELDDGYRILATFQECCPSPRYSEQQKNCAANGAFIVEAVNSYDQHRATIAALVGALEHIAAIEPVVDQRTGYVDDSAQQTAIHALQLARGEKGDVSLPASKEGV